MAVEVVEVEAEVETVVEALDGVLEAVEVPEVVGRGGGGGGASGGGESRVFSAAAAWTWDHGRGYRPSVVATVEGEVVVVDVVYVSDDVLTVQHDGPVSGRLDIA